MHPQEGSSGDVAALSRLVRAEWDTRQRDRYHLVLLVFGGMESGAIQDRWHAIEDSCNMGRRPIATEASRHWLSNRKRRDHQSS